MKHFIWFSRCVYLGVVSTLEKAMASYKESCEGLIICSLFDRITLKTPVFAGSKSSFSKLPSVQDVVKQLSSIKEIKRSQKLYGILKSKVHQTKATVALKLPKPGRVPISFVWKVLKITKMNCNNWQQISLKSRLSFLKR